MSALFENITAADTLKQTRSEDSSLGGGESISGSAENSDQVINTLSIKKLMKISDCMEAL